VGIPVSGGVIFLFVPQKAVLPDISDKAFFFMNMCHDT
jgi:hypothetical protein